LILQEATAKDDVLAPSRARAREKTLQALQIGEVWGLILQFSGKIIYKWWIFQPCLIAGGQPLKYIMVPLL
jgi:hypothetical protein